MMSTVTALSEYCNVKKLQFDLQKGKELTRVRITSGSLHHFHALSMLRNKFHTILICVGSWQTERTLSLVSKEVEVTSLQFVSKIFVKYVS